jgi:maleate isomerase
MFLEDVTAETEARMLDEFTIPAARDLATIHPDVVVFGCTSAGALRGNQYEDQLITQISDTAKAKAVSVNRSVRETLKSLGAVRLVVVTPYLEELNTRIQDSLENDGFDVMHIQGLGIRANTDIARVSTQEIVDLAKDAVASRHPDALFVSCTNFPAVSALPQLRRIFEFPVISSNQAVLDRTIQVVKNRLGE